MPDERGLIGMIEAPSSPGWQDAAQRSPATRSPQWRALGPVRELTDLSGALLAEIEQFFINYNQMLDRTFSRSGRLGAQQAVTVVRPGAGKSQKKKASQQGKGR